MKKIKQTLLHYHKGTSNKEYNVYLIEINPNAYLVNFEYGRFGAKLKEGTKTKEAVALERAEKLYNSLVVSKMNKEYKIIKGYDPTKKEEKKERVEVPLKEYKSILQERLQKALDTKVAKIDNYPISKLIYRAGELKLEESKDTIINIYKSNIDNSNVFYFSVAFTLGRYKDPKLSDILKELETKLDETSKYIAQNALLLIGEYRPTINNDIDINLLSKTLNPKLNKYSILENWEKSRYGKLIKEIKAETKIQFDYYISTYQSNIENFNIDTTNIVITKENFTLFRRLYKMAELFDDYKTLAKLINLILSQKMSCYEVYDYNYRKSNISIGCSKEYFKKRAFRLLKDLEFRDEIAYLTLSKNILINLNSYPTEFKGYKAVYDSYNYDTGRYTRKTLIYEDFAFHTTMMYIVYGNSKRYILSPNHKKYEMVNKSLNDEKRVETKKELWDNNPLVALDILIESSVSIIQKFAFDIIMDNQDKIKDISSEILAKSVNILDKEASEFFFNLLKERYNQTKEKILIQASLLSINSDIVAYALDIISLDKSILQNPELIIKSIFSIREDKLFDRMLLFVDIDITDQIIDSITDNISQIHLDRIKTILFKNISSISIKHIEYLLNSSNYKLALEIIRNESFKLELPINIKSQIASSDDPQMIATSLYLLNKLDDSDLMKEYQMLVSFLYHKEDVIATQSQKIIEELHLKSKENSSILLQEIISTSFVGVEKDIQDRILVFIEIFTTQFKQIDKDLIYRMLKAKSKLANRIGAILLSYSDVNNYSVRQWTTFAKNENQIIRKWAYQAFENNMEKVKEAMPISLMIFDTHWQDTKEFAMNYFKDFTPLSTDDIIIIADNNHNDIQNFAKELILDREVDRETILSKLSQHPSITIQNFITNLILEDITIKEILSLERFFNTILHTINQNRVAKTRILNILTNNIDNPKVAKLFSSLAYRHSLSMVWADKSIYIEALTFIKENHKDIDIPIEITPTPKRSSNYGV